MFCKNCGEPLAEKAVFCPKCGFKPGTGETFCQFCGQPVNPGAVACVNCGSLVAPTSRRSEWVAFWLALLVGPLGIHNFYLGRTKTAVVQLVLSLVFMGTVVVPLCVWIWAIVEGILALGGDNAQTYDVRLAPAVVADVSYNARAETPRANYDYIDDDYIDGVKFLAVLDGKTCPRCAALDGHIWRGDEMKNAPIQPIHPNCRCMVIPHVELKDDDGNVVNVDGERPAASADFEALAKEAYNKRAKAREEARKKTGKEFKRERRWDDLAPSTRQKYYYQAQKDFEKETGKPAYRQVPESTTFADYFESQSESFKRAWLGAKRYELYKSGVLDKKTLFNPDLTDQIFPELFVKSSGDDDHEEP